MHVLLLLGHEGRVQRAQGDADPVTPVTLGAGPEQRGPAMPAELAPHRGRRRIGAQVGVAGGDLQVVAWNGTVGRKGCAMAFLALAAMAVGDRLGGLSASCSGPLRTSSSRGKFQTQAQTFRGKTAILTTVAGQVRGRSMGWVRQYRPAAPWLGDPGRRGHVRATVEPLLNHGQVQASRKASWRAHRCGVPKCGAVFLAPKKSVILLACRSVAQSGSASALGAEGREFESRRSDQN